MYQYHIYSRLFFFILVCFVFSSVNVFAGQCAATTKKGTQCKRNTQAGSSYCWQHARMYDESESSKKITPVAKSDSLIKSSPNKKEQVSTQCAATTKKGARCKRTAKAGSSYCWQHGG